MAFTDVDVVLPLLATIEAAITGVQTAYSSPPDSIMDLPAFVNLAGPATIDYAAGDDDTGVEAYENRDYTLILLVAPFMTGISGEKYADLTPYFALVRNKFMAYQKLMTAKALQVIWRGDAGSQNTITYAGVQYYGIRFAVTIRGRVRITYASGE
jgi:hypothetical protein